MIKCVEYVDTYVREVWSESDRSIIEKEFTFSARRITLQPSGGGT